MQRDIKDIVGVLMHVLGGGEISPEELADVGFEAEGELKEALNEAYIKLLELVHDRGARLNDREIDETMRSALQECLDRIVSVCDRLPQERS